MTHDNGASDKSQRTQQEAMADSFRAELQFTPENAPALDNGASVKLSPAERLRQIAAEVRGWPDYLRTSTSVANTARLREQRRRDSNAR